MTGLLPMPKGCSQVAFILKTPTASGWKFTARQAQRVIMPMGCPAAYSKRGAVMAYHKGELEMQARAGVQAMARRIERGIHNTLPPTVQLFLHYQTLAAAASVDAHGAVWASLLAGMPGFLAPLDEQTVRLSA